MWISFCSCRCSIELWPGSSSCNAKYLSKRPDRVWMDTNSSNIVWISGLRRGSVSWIADVRRNCGQRCHARLRVFISTVLRTYVSGRPSGHKLVGHRGLLVFRSGNSSQVCRCPMKLRPDQPYASAGVTGSVGGRDFVGICSGPVRITPEQVAYSPKVR